VRKGIFFLVLFLFFSVSSAYPDPPIEFVGTALWADFEEVELRGVCLYAAFNYGLGVFDVADPSHPELIGCAYAEGEGKRVALSGSYAYLADYDGGLKVFNVSSPSEPYLVGELEFIDRANDVVVGEDNIAYVAGATRGIHVVDISDPSNPLEIGMVAVSGGCQTLCIADGYLFVAKGLSGMAIYSLSEPTSPAYLGEYSTTSMIYEIEVEGGYAYAAADMNGLLVIDYSDPAEPTVVGQYVIPSLFVYSLSVSEDYCYLGAGNQGVYIVDVSDPSSPEYVFRYYTPANFVRELVVGPPYAYLSTNKGLIVLNIANPTAVSQEGFNLRSRNYRRFYRFMNNLYCAAEFDGMDVLDITDPSDPVHISDFVLSVPFFDISVWENYVFIASGGMGMQILDVFDPEEPVFLGYYAIPEGSQALEIKVIGDWAFLVVDSLGLVKVDITDPYEPTYVAMVGGRDARSIYFEGTKCYFTSGISGLKIINWMDMSVVGHLDMGIPSTGLTKIGDYLYASCDREGVWVFDVSDEASVEFVGSFDTEDRAYYIASDSTFLYVAADDEGLQVFDVSDDPISPDNLGCFTTGGKARGLLTWRGGYIYLADNTGIFILRNTVLDVNGSPITPSEYSISAYPNPFNSSVTLCLRMQKPDRVNITVRNILGEEVAAIFDGELSAGTHSFCWEPESCAPSGLYLATVSGRKFNLSNKLLYVK